MSTENNFVELFTQTRNTFSLLSLITIWRVIYFRHYIIMTMSHLFWSLYLTPLLPVITQIYAFNVKVNCATQQIAFFAQGWNKYHDQNVYKWVKSLRVYQVFSLCECLDCKAIFSEAIFLFFGIIFMFRKFEHSFFEVLFHTVKLHPSIWIE